MNHMRALGVKYALITLWSLIDQMVAEVALWSDSLIVFWLYCLHLPVRNNGKASTECFIKRTAQDSGASGYGKIEKLVAGMWHPSTLLLPLGKKKIGYTMFKKIVSSKVWFDVLWSSGVGDSYVCNMILNAGYYFWAAGEHIAWHLYTKWGTYVGSWVLKMMSWEAATKCRRHQQIAMLCKNSNHLTFVKGSTKLERLWMTD